jgi:proton glutamate symport protein
MTPPRALVALPAPPRTGLRRIPQSQWILIAMIGGVAAGHLFPDGAGVTGWHATELQVLSDVFLRMIKSMVVPLLFGTLVVGVAGHGDDMKRVGSLALRSMLYFEVATSLALVVGLLAVNIVKPGLGVHLTGLSTDKGTTVAHTPVTLSGLLEHVVPQSIFDAASRNEALQVTVFAIIFAVALSQVEGPAKVLMLSICESLTAVMFKFVWLVMNFAPIGIGAAIAATVGRSGIGVLRHLGALVLTLYGSLAVFALVVLLPIALLFQVPVRRFLREVKEPWLIAFTTASSEAALPLALRNMERLGVPRRIASFVLPTGYAFNMDGTTLYLALASVFVAQAAGIDLPLSRQVLLMFTLMLTSKGLAAVPRASLVILSGPSPSSGCHGGVALILGVDALMDMARTSTNLLGNCLATVVMARSDGAFEPQAARPAPASGGVVLEGRTTVGVPLGRQA